MAADLFTLRRCCRLACRLGPHENAHPHQCQHPAACGQVLLASHAAWFRMQRCKDRFEACLGLSALRAASPGGVSSPSKPPPQPRELREWVEASQVQRPVPLRAYIKAE